ncbi:hypothetical protein [Massilia sp. Leaf139]|uniref:hypothetical protein n=1 Tax=Massilia sp. Leaf139 TaxID=1736272 RepID=UPI0006FE9130|nr:hypothetical protein [Massilia sp. Leaf139]KQQ96124.1 hypothetical protein ASF77_21710 [Massilia sp. Leaf139]
MATIGAAVSAQMKNQFYEEARARSWTPSSLAGHVLAEFLAGRLRIDEPPAKAPRSSLILAPPPPLETRTEQVIIRLQPYHYGELSRLAEERRWFPGTYLASLTAAHIEARPVMCAAEINALRQVARQLADLGRNFNQIARSLNSSPKEAHKAMGMEIDLVRMLVDLETNAVKELIGANVRGWGIAVDSSD